MDEGRIASGEIVTLGVPGTVLFRETKRVSRSDGKLIDILMLQGFSGKSLRGQEDFTSTI